jgi:hypothetical protein
MIPSAARTRPTGALLVVSAALLMAGAGFAVGQQTRGPAPARRVIQPGSYKPTPSPLVPGILVGDTLYLSGSTGGSASQAYRAGHRSFIDVADGIDGYAIYNSFELRVFNDGRVRQAPWPAARCSRRDAGMSLTSFT